MADKSASTGNTPVKQSESTHRRVRWKSGAMIVCTSIATIAAINTLVLDKTFRVIGIYYGIAAWGIVAAVWWMLFSGTDSRVRIGLASAVAGTAVAVWSGLIVRLDFDGAMAPIPVWRWQTSAAAERDTWSQGQARTTTSDPTLEAPFAVGPDDWPRYCGADGSRVVREALTIRDWKQHPPEQLWRHPIGEGWSSFAVVGARLFTQEQRADSECIVCYHAETGNELWVHRDETRYDTSMGGIGPRATPTVTDSALYAIGATGLLTCLNPVTGDLIWQRNVANDAGTSPPEWGYSGSPLVWGDTVIVIAGGSDDSGVLAYDHRDGDMIWGSGSHSAGYSSPRIEMIAGKSVLQST